MDKDENNLTKNISGKDFLLAILVVVLLVTVGWYKEVGNQWAILIFSLIPVIGIIYWLRIPHEKRIEAEKNVNEELKKTTIGKFWILLKWSLFIIVGIAVAVSFIK